MKPKPSQKIGISLLDNNRMIKMRQPSNTPSYFCQVGSFFSSAVHKPRCKCSPSKPCFQQMSWLAYTSVNSLSEAEAVYSQLSQNRYNQIDYAYEIIDLQIYKKFSVVLMGSNQKEVLRRILVKFANNNHKNKKKPYTEACGWLAVHILYHCSEASTYVIMQSLVDRLGLLEDQLVRQHEYEAFRRLESILYEALAILRQYNINPMEIIRFFSNDVFAKSIPIQFMGWNIQNMFVSQWEHFYLLLLSYIDFKLETNVAQTRNQLYKSFFSTGNVQWPIVFANMSVYKKQPQTRPPQI